MFCVDTIEATASVSQIHNCANTEI